MKVLPLAIGYPILVGSSMVGVNLLAIWLFGEAMDLRHYLGMALVFIGILLRNNPSFQLAIMLLTLFTCYVLHMKHRPYMSSVERRLAPSAQLKRRRGQF